MKCFEGLVSKSRSIRNAAEALYPPHCLACDKIIVSGNGLCRSCNFEKQRITESCCHGCGCGVSGCSCSKKFRFSAVIAPFYYDGSVRRAIHSIKFNRRGLHTTVISDEMLAAIEREYVGQRFDCVVCVPKTAKMRRRRCYNQSAVLAGNIAKALALPFDEYTLVKAVETRDQVSLSDSERYENVVGVFTVGKKKDVLGKTVLLCDDVKTTGATLGDCTRALLEAGAKEIFCVVAAVTEKKGGHRLDRH